VKVARVSELQHDRRDEISLLDIALTIKANWRLLIAGPLAVGALALGVSFVIPPSYTARTQFLPPQPSAGGGAAAMLQGLGPLGGLAGAATGLKNPSDQFVSFLRSDSVERGVVERFKLKERYEVDLTIDAMYVLDANTKITSGKDGLIGVEVDDRDPKFAAQLANGYIEELRKLLDRVAVTEAQQRRVFYEQQLAKTQEKLKVAQSELQKSGIREGTLRSEPRSAAEAYAALKAQVTAAEVTLQTMLGRVTEQSSEYRAAKASLNALRAQLAKAEATDSAAASDDYIGRYRDFKYLETVFDMFAKQYELAKLDEAKEGATIQVVDVALPPERKSKPRK
jgi:uncharacterized protein involved in exopolysaccharide biosynthesis